VKLPQLPRLPQSQDTAQAGLKHTQSRLAYIIDQLLLARGNDIGSPQQQPRINQRQRQPQAFQTVSMPHPSELQTKASAIVFAIFKHFLNAMSTKDKACCTRRDALPLSRWRRPKRLRG